MPSITTTINSQICYTSLHTNPPHLYKRVSYSSYHNSFILPHNSSAIFSLQNSLKSPKYPIAFSDAIVYSTNIQVASEEVEMYQQPYDTSMKAMLQEDAQEIVSELLPGTIFIDALDIDVLPAVVRADQVYRVLYHDL